MATFLSSPITPPLNSHHTITTATCNTKTRIVRCSGQNPSSNSSTKGSSEPENALLKVAWYGSEILGIAASFFRSPSDSESPQSDLKLSTEGLGPVDRSLVVDTIKDDFQRSYFVTGNLTMDAYEEDCEFADPAGSFKGLKRFKRNCTNFGLLIEKSDMKLTKWEDFEVDFCNTLWWCHLHINCSVCQQKTFDGLFLLMALKFYRIPDMVMNYVQDKGIGHWKFSCIMSFPWRPILSATGYTEYYYDAQSGKVCRHVEHWNVPKMALLKQLLRPSKRRGS